MFAVNVGPKYTIHAVELQDIALSVVKVMFSILLSTFSSYVRKQDVNYSHI